MRANVTQEDILNIINKVDSYGIVPQSLIDHAKQEVKSLNRSDLEQISNAKELGVKKFGGKLSPNSSKDGAIPDSIKKDLETIKENAKKRQKLLDSVMEE